MTNTEEKDPIVKAKNLFEKQGERAILTASIYLNGVKEYASNYDYLMAVRNEVIRLIKESREQ